MRLVVRVGTPELSAGIVSVVRIKMQQRWRKCVKRPAPTRAMVIAVLQPEVQARRGMSSPREMEQYYVENTGRTWERYHEEPRGLEGISLTYQGVEALASAGDPHVE